MGSGASSEAVKTKVQTLIKDNKVMVFSKSTCPFCVKTKSLLKQIGVNAKIVELNTSSDGSSMQNYLQELSGQRTVPNIFIGGKHIGGNSEI